MSPVPQRPALPPATPPQAPPSAASLPDDQIWALFRTPVWIRESQVEQEFLATARCDVLKTHGLKLATYCWGDGAQTVLLLHGWGGRAAQLRAFVPPLLERGYRVLALDAPGHGRSEGVRPSMFQIAETIQEFGRCAGPFAGLIAHSMGAASATMALGRGLPVRRAALIAPMCRLTDALTRFVVRLKLSPEQRARLCARLESEFGADMWDQSSLVWVGPRLTLPALIVHDRGDAEIPYQDGVDTAAAWRGAELLTTEGLGHRLILRDLPVVTHVTRFVTAPSE